MKFCSAIANLVPYLLLLLRVAPCNVSGSPDIENNLAESHSQLVFDAVKSGDYPKLEWLLNAGHYVDVNARNASNQTALHIVCKSNWTEAIKLLFQNGASILATDNSGFTALHFIARGKLESLIEFRDHPDISFVINVRNNQGCTPLHLATFNKDPKIANALIECGADVNAPDARLQTPLHYAVKAGQFEISKMLLNKNANVNAQDENLDTPLHFAVQRRYSDIFTLLIHYGADASAKNDYGQNSLHTAACSGFQEIEMLLDICLYTRLKKVVYSVVTFSSIDIFATYEQPFKAFIDSKDKNGRTPLHYAAMHGHDGIVAVLMDLYADVDAHDHDCQTPLGFALDNGHNQTFVLLLKRDADIDADAAPYGGSLLHVAVQNNNHETAKFLLKNGADVYKEDLAGRTPLDYAIYNESVSMIDLLHECGVNRNFIYR